LPLRARETPILPRKVLRKTIGALDARVVAGQGLELARRTRLTPDRAGAHCRRDGCKEARIAFEACLAFKLGLAVPRRTINARVLSTLGLICSRGAFLAVDGNRSAAVLPLRADEAPVLLGVALRPSCGAIMARGVSGQGLELARRARLAYDWTGAHRDRDGRIKAGRAFQALAAFEIGLAVSLGAIDARVLTALVLICSRGAILAVDGTRSAAVLPLRADEAPILAGVALNPSCGAIVARDVPGQGLELARRARLTSDRAGAHCFRDIGIKAG
jgi:hypothetical protein